MSRRLLSISGLVLVLGTAGVLGAWQFATPSEHTGTTSTTTTAVVTTTTASTVPAPTTTLTPLQAHPLPAGSGEGRRVVFSVSGQRMWWVDETGAAIRTAAVSGRENTPATGTFQVYSRTEHATGLDGSKMDQFVRFTKGERGWAIGFHGIPTMDGVPVQTVEQLGQPLSHGCIRQAPEDAAFTWDFLQVGDTVVVVA